MNNKDKIRNSNIELLRIISILLIIIFHYVYKSNYQYTTLTTTTLLIKSMYFLGELGVNLFILITGYHLCNSKPSIKKTILLIAEVFFYNIITYIISIFSGYSHSFDYSLIFPIVSTKYWFISAYILVYILSPFYNILIKNLTKQEYQKFILINLLIWSIIPTVFGLYYNSTETVFFYNRFIWLSFLYFTGAYINIHHIKFFSSPQKSLITSIVTFSTMIISIIIIYLFKNIFSHIGTTEIAYLWTPNNIFMFILSISLFTFFTQINIKTNLTINKIASTTLGIYLIQGPYLWEKIVNCPKNIYSNHWYIHLIITTLSIFTIGLIIDLIRQFIEKHTIKKLLNNKIWNKILPILKKETQSVINKFL